jgi:hypothetical protein
MSTQYLQRAADNKHLLHREFLSLDYQEGTEIMTHVTNIETMASQLKELDVHVSDDEIMAKILSTLPRTFEHMETAWDSMQSNEKTLDNLRARLIQKERKIKRRQSENNGSRKEEREALAANIILLAKKHLMIIKPRQTDLKITSTGQIVTAIYAFVQITGPTSIDQVNVKEIKMETKDAHKQRETEPIYPTQTKRRTFP